MDCSSDQDETSISNTNGGGKIRNNDIVTKRKGNLDVILITNGRWVSPISERRWLVSRQVPLPKIRPGGTDGPAILAATAVMISHGFETMQMGDSVLYLSSSGMMNFIICTKLKAKIQTISLCVLRRNSKCNSNNK